MAERAGCNTIKHNGKIQNWRATLKPSECCPQYGGRVLLILLVFGDTIY